MVQGSRKLLVAFLILFLGSLSSTVKGSSLSDALSAAFVEVAADGTYADCYSAFGVQATLPDTTQCPLYPAEPSGALARVINNRLLRLGVIVFEPAAFFTNQSTGLFDGTEIRLARLIARKLGTHYGVTINIQWVWVTEQTSFFDQLKAGLDAGSYDAVMSGVANTPTRATVVDFTCSYITTYLGLLRGILEPSKNFTVIPDQLNDPSVRIGALAGTTGSAWLQTHVPRATVTYYPNEYARVMGAKNGEVHFIIGDKIVLSYGLTVQHPPCPGCSLLSTSLGAELHYAIFTTKEAAPPTPTPSPTPKPSPTPRPRPGADDLKRGTIFSLFVIGFFCVVLLLMVIAGVYWHMRN